MKQPLIAFLILLSVSLTNAQNICGTDYYNSQRSDVSNWKNVMDREIPNTGYRSNTKYIIPVVFHIIHQNGTENISDAKVYELIQTLNEDYSASNSDLSIVRDTFKNLIADINVEFRLARIDPYGKCTKGINRVYSPLTSEATDEVKSTIVWDNTKYLNIWVVKSINNFGQDGTILGYSTFPSNTLSDLDGIVLRADVVGTGKRTLSHEAGHYMGLYHPFQGGCYGSGDQVKDTPKEAKAHFDCDFSTNSCTNESPDLPDMLENHMAYSSCGVMFTEGQKTRMHYYLDNYRSNLYSEGNLKATGVFDTNSISCKINPSFNSNFKFICSGNVVAFADQSISNSTISYNWYFEGGSPSTTTERNPLISYSKEGVYQVKLVVKDANGSDSLIRNEYITVFPNTGYSLPFSEGFENTEFLHAPWIVDYDENSDLGWKVSGLAAATGTKSFLINNYTIESSNSNYAFILPPLNLNGEKNAKLEFDLAGAKTNNESSDQLRIYVSTDCGQSFALKKVFVNDNAYSTSVLYSSEFIPSASDWKHIEFDLSRFVDQSNVMIKVYFKTGSGNNFYIDNINVSSDVSSSVKDREDQEFLIYPNPASDYIRIRNISGNSFSGTIRIYNSLGKMLFEKPLITTSGNFDTEINLNNFPVSEFLIIELQSEKMLLRKKVAYIR